MGSKAASLFFFVSASDSLKAPSSVYCTGLVQCIISVESKEHLVFLLYYTILVIGNVEEQKRTTSSLIFSDQNDYFAQPRVKVFSAMNKCAYKKI